MGKFMRISDKCSIIVSVEFGLAIIGAVLGIVASLIDFVLRFLSPEVSFPGITGFIGIIFSVFGFLAASELVRERKLSGKILIFSGVVVLLSSGIFGLPNILRVTELSPIMRVVSFLPFFTFILFLIGGKILFIRM